MNNKKGQRSSFAGRSNAPANGRAGSALSSPPAPAIATPASTSAAPTNAWVRPLQQRATRPPPGMGGPLPVENPKVIDNNANTHILRDRFLHLTCSMVGQKVVVTQTNGAVIEGVFCTFTPFASQPPQTRNIYAIKGCRLIKSPTAPDDKFILHDGDTVMISVDKVSNVLVKSMRLDSTGSNGTSHSGASKGVELFQTDAEIATAKNATRSGDLIAAGSAWTSPVVASSNSRADALLGGLEEKGVGSRTVSKQFSNTTTGLRGNIGEWDQFKANEELFNVSAKFDESIYTTELDKSQIDAKKIAEAERIAREIEQMTSSNIHLAEERGQAVEIDYDEEDRFSGVLPKDSVTRNAATPRKEKQSEKSSGAVPSIPVTNSRAIALKGAITADGQKKSLAPPPKKMNYAAAVAAQVDTAKKASTSPPSAVAVSTTSSSLARVTPERPPQTDMAMVSPDEKLSTSEEHPKASIELIDSVPPTEVSVSAIGSEQERVEDLAVEIANMVVEEVVEEKPPEAPSVENAEDTYELTLEDKQPLEDVSETRTEGSEAPKKVGSKLNANAKEFTLNPSAKAFTPNNNSASTPIPAAVVPDTTHFVDPNNIGMPMGHALPHMHGVHYMPAGHMGQHGMMPMNPQYQFRFQPPYPTMDPSMAPMISQQHQAMQHHQPVGGDQHGAAPPSVSGSVEEDSMGQQQRDISSQQQTPHMQPVPQQAQAPPQQMHMQYHVAPPGYFPGMAMPPRGPGVPHMAGYAPQFVSPQQMQMVPNAGPFRPIYPPMQPAMPPNMQMRPYYPAQGTPMHYPPNAFPMGGRLMDDGDYRGGRGARGGTAGRGRRGGRRGGGRGSGRTYYPPGGGGSGRQTPQTPTELGDGAPPELQDGTLIMHGGDMPSVMGNSDDQREPAD